MVFAENQIMLIVLTTVPSVEEAESLASGIVENKLAACAQIMPPMTSIYVWEGKVQRENEHLMLIKTLPDKYAELEEFITANHSYGTPEIVAVDAAHVSLPYLSWIEDLLRNN